MPKNSISDIAQEISKSKSFLIFTHIFPDPDAIGSAFALAQGLITLGKHANVHIPQGIIPRMLDLVSTEIDLASLDLSKHDFDYAIIVDTANKERASGLMTGIKTINIDHHESNDLWGDLNYIDATSPSSTVIVAELLAELGLKSLDSKIANLLFAGLSDDTGSFKFSNATPRAFKAAATFIEAGASPSDIANRLYFSQKANRIKLQAKALQDLRFYLSGKVSLLTLTQALLEECEASADDTDGLVDIARSVEGVEVAVFIRQNAEKWKVSLRSKSDNISVNAIANLFGGGGHPAAAGCTLTGDIKDVEKKIITSIGNFL